MAINETDTFDIEETIYSTEDAKTKSNRWMLDSGTSQHMTYRQDIFTEYVPYCTAI